MFQEFQSSIKRYLFYYNNVVFLLSNKNALTFISHIAKQLLIHLTILTEICDYAVPKYSTKIHSIKLLNYFYKKISTSSNKQVLYLLLSILHPCFQVYYRLVIKCLSKTQLIQLFLVSFYNLGYITVC